MKSIVFTVILLFCIFSKNILSQDSNIQQDSLLQTITSNQKPHSRVGATVGTRFYDEIIGVGFTSGIFFHHTLSKSWFLRLNLGYYYNKIVATGVPANTTGSVHTYPVSLGLGVFLSHSGIRPNLGVEFGYMKKDGYYEDIPLITSSSLFINALLGLSIPVSPKINFESSVKIGVPCFRDIYINSGISYNIPY